MVLEAAIAATPKKPPTRETLRVLIRWCLLGIIHAVGLLYLAPRRNGRGQTPVVRSGSFCFDSFSMGLHVVGKHHYDFAIVSDIHKANAVERTMQNLYNGSLRDHNRNIPRVPLSYSHCGTSETKERAVFHLSSFHIQLEESPPI